MISHFVTGLPNIRHESDIIKMCSLMNYNLGSMFVCKWFILGFINNDKFIEFLELSNFLNLNWHIFVRQKTERTLFSLKKI